ncbi:hypothetical protein B7494_g4197 [Chlorociboria aeruginascens]|nr:hypothetical protein B7494_g4197 [Chlorociboria aeruginascens]
MQMAKQDTVMEQYKVLRLESKSWYPIDIENLDLSGALLRRFIILNLEIPSFAKYRRRPLQQFQNPPVRRAGTLYCTRSRINWTRFISQIPIAEAQQSAEPAHWFCNFLLDGDFDPRATMDSKRKVSGGASLADDLDDRAAKRRKGPHGADFPDGETFETTTKYGLRLIEQIKRTEDKSGRLVATNFLTLPSKRQLPDYYKVTRMPIAIDTIEARLQRQEFPTLTTLESYFKRMISNAKEYNEKGSEIYEDAERLRKALSNFMTKTNPAYRTPGYVAFPTPLPVEGSNSSDVKAEGKVDNEVDDEIEAAPAKRRAGRLSKGVSQIHSTTPALSESQHAEVGFTGLTFQQAQEKIISDLIEHKELPEDDFSAFEPFVDLPPRRLKDYYQVITNPVSLKVLQKRVKGDGTGISDFKTWASFEEESSYIWKNAWLYNEDGSEISELAKDLEKFFNKILKEAKQAAPEPAGAKIKLKLPDHDRRITIKLGGNKASPAGSPAPQANGSISNGINAAGGARRNPFSNSTPIPSLDPLDRARSMSGSAVPSPTPSGSALVKNEEVAQASPAISAGYPVPRAISQATPTPTGSSMLPPNTPGLPNGITHHPSGYAQSFNHQPIHHVQNPVFDTRWRLPGKSELFLHIYEFILLRKLDASDALITNLSLATHPHLNISHHFRMDVPPSATMAQQSITINLPSTHYYLQIKPTIASSLLDRQHKLFVTSGNQRLPALPTIPGHSVDRRHPLFEARLLPGVNRIEIEMIAALPKGAPKAANGQDLELEKITVFANLMKA